MVVAVPVMPVVVVPVVVVPIVAHRAARCGAIVMVSTPPEGFGWCGADGLDARKCANGNRHNHKCFHLHPPELHSSLSNIS